MNILNITASRRSATIDICHGELGMGRVLIRHGQNWRTTEEKTDILLKSGHDVLVIRTEFKLVKA
jgi:hypothetical protein